MVAQDAYAANMALIIRRNSLVQHMLFLEAGAPRPSGMLGFIIDENALMTTVLSGESAANRLRVFLNNHRMCMVVYAYEAGEDLIPAAVNELPAECWSLPPHAAEDPHRIPYDDSTRIRRGEGEGPDPSKGVVVVSMARSSLRELGRNLRELQQPIRYRFVVGTRSLGGTVVEIARSELVDFAAPEPRKGAFGGMFVECNIGRTGFDVRRIQSPPDDTAALESVLWCIAEDQFVDTALACINQSWAAPARAQAPGPMMDAALEID
jgi:hypothetical protein